MSVLFTYTANKDKKSRIVVPKIERAESIEVVLEESYNYSNNVSNNPIEDGSDIADHIHTAPLVYSLTAMYTNAPLTRIDISASELPELTGFSLFGIQLLAPNKQAQKEYQTKITEVLSEKTSEFIDYIPSVEAFYEELIKEKHVVTIETKSKILEDMVCIDFSYTRDKSSGSGLVVTARFQQIKLVSTDTVEIQRRDSAIQSSKTNSGVTAETKNTGKKNTQAVAPGSQGSLLHKLVLGR